jgi:hypothetical protein
MGSGMKSHSIVYGALVACVACCLAWAASLKTKCARCGCEEPCKKVCRLVCEEKKVEVVCWGCKCEDFCVPGPGCPTCEHCNCVCQSCGKDGTPSKVCSAPKRLVWYDWRPSFAQMYTKTKLMRRTEVVKVPTYKWVVEDVCCDCARGCDCSDCVAIDVGPAPGPEKK